MSNTNAANFFGGTGSGPLDPSGHLLVELVDALDGAGHLTAFQTAAGGDAERERRLALVHFHAYANGTFGARRLAAQMESDEVIRTLAGGEATPYRQLIEYRDTANERLALFFTEVIVALADCGLTSFLHTPLHTVAETSTRIARARAGAELAVALLNAAKRRDDIETARYGLQRRGDELPPALSDPNERAAVVAAVLRLRTADTEGGSWDEPTKLIDLSAVEGGLDLRSTGDSHREQVESAATEARSGLLPRLRSDQWAAVVDEAPGGSEGWRPDADSHEATTAEQARIDAAHSTVERLPDPDFDGSDQARTAPTDAAADADEAEGAGAEGTEADDETEYLFTKPPDVAPPKRDASAVAGRWLMDRWRVVIWTLIILVVAALLLTLQQF